MRCSRSFSRRLGVLALLFILAGGLALSGCDFLEKSPKGELTSDNFFEDEQSAVQATNATYNVLREWQVHVFSWLGMTEIASDDATKGSVPSDASFLLDLQDKSFDASTLAFEETWAGYYTGVYRANVALQNIPSVDMEEDLQDRLMGENKFLRAYYYFFLVRAYGGVPQITAPLKPDEFEQSRASRDSIYALIERDLNDAIDALPPRSAYGEGEQGRTTQGAAEGLLAKVHLFQEEYDEALAHAENVITSNEYSLLDDYGTIFRKEGEYSDGSLFEVGAVSRESGAEGSSQYAQVQGVRGSANNGWGFNQPSDDLETSFEPGDPRHQATILHPWEELPDGSGVVAEVNPNMENQRYNEKVQPSVETSGGSGNNTVNIRRLRYADVLLIAAEAAYETGDQGTARQYLNDVRERAREGRSVTLGLQPETMAEPLAETLGLADSGPHVFVRYAGEDGAAAQAGLESFAYSEDPVLVETLDVVEAIDGTEVTTRDDYRQALDNVTAGETVSVEVTRVEQEESGGSVTTTTEEITTTITAQELLPDVTAGGQDLLEAIWAERRAELAMEQHRYFDLIRQGRADEELDGFESRHEVYPIPQSEIDLSGDAMEQNDGY
ncbi:MAG: RagB/SusD family nutrient uptake outer membrane protein [Salinibacter sp.]